MADTSPGAVTLPSAHDDDRLFDPPGTLTELRQNQPVTRLAFPDGHVGWLITKHSLGRQVLSDPRFSARQELVHFPVKLPISQRPEPAQPGWFVRMDPPDHTRLRRLLTSQFTMHRLNKLAPRVEAIAEEHLDFMELQGPPADLVESYALPIPTMAICELLGVPYAERDRFHHHAAMLTRLNTTKDDVLSAISQLGGYLHELMLKKRAEPSDDLLSGLASSPELTDEELTNIAMLLLLTGHETTAHMIAYGVYALLRHPAQLAALRENPELADRAVDELLRYLSIVETGISRAALTDVRLDGQLIEAGQTVTVWISTANRDPAFFSNPDVLDISRPAAGHLSFGHGIHQCLGQPLARIEMRVAYNALFRRFPRLRPAVPAHEVPLRNGMAVFGVQELPLAW